MVSLLNITVIVFAIAWLTGYLGFSEDGHIHVLLFIVIFCFLLRLLQEHKLLVRKWLGVFHRKANAFLFHGNEYPGKDRSSV
jgi:hypothetical protein